MKSVFIKQSICCLVLLSLISCTPRDKNRESEKEYPVKTLIVNADYNNLQKEYIGIIEGKEGSDISFQVPGNIKKVYFEEGQSIQKGELLAELDITTLKNAYDATRASLTRARDAYNRMSILYENNSLPEIKYIEVKSALEQANSAEQIAYKNLNDCKLYAPFSGIIAKRFADTGANVMAGIPIYNIVTINTVKVKVAIPEKEISSIAIGERCDIKVSALDNEVFNGVIIEKGITAHPISHTYSIKIEVQNHKLRMMPGMICKAYLTTNSKNNSTIIVPLKAVQLDSSGQHYLWIRDNQSRASYRKITVGQLVGNNIIIEDGLKDGEMVIVEGYQHIGPNSLVSISE